MELFTRRKLGLEERVKWAVQEDRGSIPRWSLGVLFRFESWRVDCLFGYSVWVCGSWWRVANSIFFLEITKKRGFLKMRKRLRIFRKRLRIFHKRLRIFRNLFFLFVFFAYVISVTLFVIITSISWWLLSKWITENL